MRGLSALEIFFMLVRFLVGLVESEEFVLCSDPAVALDTSNFVGSIVGVMGGVRSGISMSPGAWGFMVASLGTLRGSGVSAMSCASDRSRVASAKKRAELTLISVGVADPSVSCDVSSDNVEESSSLVDRRSKSPSWWEGSVDMLNSGAHSNG